MHLHGGFFFRYCLQLNGVMMNEDVIQKADDESAITSVLIKRVGGGKFKLRTLLAQVHVEVYCSFQYLTCGVNEG